MRNDSFKTTEFVSLARKHGAAIVIAHSDKYPLIADVTADFVYARLQCSRPKIATGYTTADIKAWAAGAKAWEAGKAAKDLPLLAAAQKPAKVRDVFVYVISGAKERAPAAAAALLEELK